MNTKLTALTLAAATAFAFTPKPAKAGDTGAAIVGGLVGGIILGAVLADHDDHDRVVMVNDRCDDGYWKMVEVRVWVPGVWVVERDYRGCAARRYIAGHYECRNDRVWVAYDRYDYRGDYRHGREVGRGYGRDYDRRNYDRHDDRRDRDHRR